MISDVKYACKMEPYFMVNMIRVYNVVNNFHMFEDHIYHEKCCIKDWPMMIQNVFPFAI